MNTTIRIEGASRPCMVHSKDGDKRGLFHGWFQLSAHGFMLPEAVVELEDGSVIPANIGDLSFIDSEAVFSQYCWDKAMDDAL